MKLIDVSVPLDTNTPTYPGNTAFSLEGIKRIARGDSSNVSTLHMSAHSGTHVDAPRHFFDNAPGADALPLEMLFGRNPATLPFERWAVSHVKASQADKPSANGHMPSAMTPITAYTSLSTLDLSSESLVGDTSSCGCARRRVGSGSSNMKTTNGTKQSTKTQ